jgi:hypothetical protein
MKLDRKVASRRLASAKARTGVLLAVVATSAYGGCHFDDFVDRMASEQAQARDAMLNSSLSESSGSSEGTESPDPQNPPPSTEYPPL